MHKQGHHAPTAVSGHISAGTVTPPARAPAVAPAPPPHLTTAHHHVPSCPHQCTSICSLIGLNEQHHSVSVHSGHWHPLNLTEPTSAEWGTSCLVRCLPNHKWLPMVICNVLRRFRASFASFVSLCQHPHYHQRPQHGRNGKRCEARVELEMPSTGQQRPHPPQSEHQWSSHPCPLLLLWLILMLRITLTNAFTDSESSPTSSYNLPMVHRDHHRHRPVQKQTEIGVNITRILDSFFTNNSYDKRVRPNYAGPPVEVGVTMHIISISSISAVQMDFTSDFYFRQAWRDPRLSFTPRPGIEALFVGAEVSEKIWVPDTFFANEKAAQFHMATTPNTFIRIKATGEVFRSMRLTVTSSCPMNLQYFPMDRQSCTIEVESYGYSMADIQYKWGIDGKGSVVLAQNLELPQFKVNKHRQMQKVEVLSTGNYSRLVCEIEFVRSMGYYLIQIYIPASLIVIISWVSFWLHRNASPARVQLGVTTVLTMTTLMSSTNAAMPKISYIKSIDVFLGTCFVMVFAALLEYATVGYMGKRIAMRKTRTQQIVRLLNEHREKCIAAAAAAAASAKTKDEAEAYHERPHRNHSGAGQSSLIRTASLYPCLERVDHDDSHLAHKRDFRSSSTAGQACYHSSGQYSQQQASQSSHQAHSNRPLERSSSLKSRIFTELDEQEQVSAGINNFNDDLSVFVPATSTGNSCCATSSYYPSSGAHGSGCQSPQYHMPRHSASEPCYQPGGSKQPDRAYMSSPAYLVKDPNTLFGVCPSDIDKYSRVVFPVCFLCFNLMYWIIYMHISEFLIDDQGANITTHTTDESG